MLAIRMDNVSKHFKSKKAVENLSLKVEEGVVLGFLGPNGAGKTTTISLLLGLIDMSGGDAEVLGYNVKEQAELIRKHSGVVLDEDGLYDNLSGWDNLLFYGKINGLANETVKERTKDLSGNEMLLDRLDDRVSQYSTGMRKRLAITRALLTNPRLLFLDEPTAGLDPKSVTELRENIIRLKDDENITIFLTTHNLAEAQKVCDEVAIINHGRLVAHEKTEKLTDTIDKSAFILNIENMKIETTDIILNYPSIKNFEHVSDGFRIFVNDGFHNYEFIRYLVEKEIKVNEFYCEKVELEKVFLQLIKDGSEDE